MSLRKSYKRGSLSKEHIDKLNSINFTWDYRAEAWTHSFNLLLEYKREYGHCNVLIRSKFNGYSLGHWVQRQRTRNAEKKLTQDQMDKLNSIGFSWSVSKSWLENYQLLKKYYDKHKHTHLPHNYTVDDTNLWNWSTLQRKNYRNKKLSQDRIDKLDKLNFEWELITLTWEQSYQTLVKYYKEHGNSQVTQSYEKINTKLANWVRTQRMHYKQGKLTHDQINKLNSINFVWTINTPWEVLYELLVEYKKNNGDCYVHFKHVANNHRLGSWVRKQRVKYKTGCLSQERIDKLNDIGFAWVATKKAKRDYYYQKVINESKFDKL